MILLLVACAPEDLPSLHQVFEVVDLGRLTTDDAGNVEVPVPTESDDVAGMIGCGPFGPDNSGVATAGALRAMSAANYTTVGWPQAPDQEAPNGTIPFAFTSDALPMTVSCQGIRRMGAVPDSGTLALDVTFMGLHGIDMYEAAGVEPWLEALDAVDGMLGQVGIRLGEVTYQDGDATLSELPAAEGDLLVDSVPDSGGVVIPVFVPEVYEGQDQNVRVPAWPETGASPSSGVIVSGLDYDTDTDAFARRLAHALGHHLGLFHTEEADGTPDPVSDSSPGDNVMDLEPGASFTADQGAVMRSSVAVSE